MNERPRAIAVLIAVFLVGCMAGSAGSYFWLRRSLAGPMQSADRMMPRHFRRGPHLPELLSLTPEQDARFRQVMDELREQLQALDVERAPKIDRLRIETNRRLSAILSEEQRRKFESFIKEMEARRKRAPHGPDVGPPPSYRD